MQLFRTAIIRESVSLFRFLICNQIWVINDFTLSTKVSIYKSLFSILFTCTFCPIIAVNGCCNQSSFARLFLFFIPLFHRCRFHWLLSLSFLVTRRQVMKSFKYKPCTSLSLLHLPKRVSCPAMEGLRAFYIVDPPPMYLFHCLDFCCKTFFQFFFFLILLNFFSLFPFCLMLPAPYILRYFFKSSKVFLSILLVVAFLIILLKVRCIFQFKIVILYFIWVFN